MHQAIIIQSALRNSGIKANINTQNSILLLQSINGCFDAITGGN